MSFEQIFDQWLASLSVEERQNFFPYSLRSVLSLRQVRIDFEFLSACAHFWDPSRHVFRFGDVEICPLPEEFGAILGYPEDAPPALPTVEGSFMQAFQSKLGLSRSQVKEFFIEGEVDLRIFVSTFFPYPSSSSGAMLSRQRKRAFLFCLLHRFFFVGARRDRGHPFFVELVEQVLDDHTPAHLIVGETLMGLDRLHLNPHEAHSGSPLLLQIWLQEHLGIIRRPADASTYSARSFCTRKRCISRSSREEWVAFLRARPVVRFRVPWWNLHSMVGGHERVTHRRILGLTRATFFIPHRLRRQYGLAQRIPEKDDGPPEGLDLTDRYIEGWRGYWAKGVKWVEPRVKDSTYATEYYKEWMTSHDPKKRSLLRELEYEEVHGRPAPTLGVVIREPNERLSKKKEEVKGKGKEKMKDGGKPPKKWRRDDGSSSGM